MLNVLRLIGFRHLWERPVRTCVTVVGIALGAAVFVAILTANTEVLQTFQNAVLQIAGRTTLQISAGELGVDEQLIAVVRQHPAVIAATPVVHQAARVATGAHAGRAIVIMGLDLLEATSLKEFRLPSRPDSEAALDPLLETNAVFLGEDLAAELGLRVDESVGVLVGTRTYRLVVSGIIRTNAGPRATWSQLAVMDIAAAQFLFGLIGKLDRIEVITEPGQVVAEVADDLRKQLPPSLQIARPVQRNEQVERLLRAMRVNLSALSSVGLLIGFLLVFNTVSFAVVQRRREIGLFRTLGMTRGAVVALFLTEAGILGLLGGILGTVIGVVLARGILTLLSRSVSELYVSVDPTILQASVEVFYRQGLWNEGCALGIIVATIGAIGPAVDAGRTQPARALAPGDYEAQQDVSANSLAGVGLVGLVLSALLTLPGSVRGIPVWGYASTFALLFGLSCLSPFVVRSLGSAARSRQPSGSATGIGIIVRIAIDQVTRSPGRNSVTVSALMVGLSVMIGVGVMIGSFRQTVEQWIEQTVRADLVVAPANWLQGDDSGMLSKRLPVGWQDKLSMLSGVAAVDPYREVTVQIGGETVSLVSRNLTVHARHSRYLFKEGEADEILGKVVLAEGVVVSEVLAERLHVRRGDVLHIDTPSGPGTFPILGVFYDYATDGGKVVMDSAVYRRLWRDETATVLAMYLLDGASGKEVGRQIINAFGREEHLTLISNAELRSEILAIFDRTFHVTYALEWIAVIIALLGIFNTILTSVLERQRELATLRAIGMSRTQIAGLTLCEASWLGLMGIGLGMVGGMFLSLLLIEVINKQSFGWTIQWVFLPGLLIEAVGLALVAALAAGYVPAHWAARQPIADGLRYE